MSKELEEAFSKNVGTVYRCFTGLLIFVAGLFSCLMYYAIEYDLCINSACDKLVVTSAWVSSSGLFVVMGLGYIGIGLGILKSKQLSKFQCISITLAMGVGWILSSAIYFAISKELRLIT